MIYYVRCGVDGWVNTGRPYTRFGAALAEANRLDRTESCGPHTVTEADNDSGRD